MIKTGIIGGAGYTAGELLRLLIRHPEAEIVNVVSQSHAGKYVHEAHPDLNGEIHLHFQKELSGEVEVVFLCSGHGKSKALVENGAIPTGCSIIDLSSDFRLQSGEHDFVYGLPELYREAIKKAKYIANPGCFATCIQLSLLPLAKNGLLKKDIHITAITGSTGAGQNPTDTTHFSWRSNNASVYKAFTHQHLDEIKQSIMHAQPKFKKGLYFIPMRGAFTRGILAACYTGIELEAEEIKNIYQSYYREHPFVHITDIQPDVKQVVNSNKCFLHISKDNGQILITSVIDNLLKGASGQAVQNMNLMFGLDETSGLILKPSAF